MSSDSPPGLCITTYRALTGCGVNTFGPTTCGAKSIQWIEAGIGRRFTGFARSGALQLTANGAVISTVTSRLTDVISFNGVLEFTTNIIALANASTGFTFEARLTDRSGNIFAMISPIFSMERDLSFSLGSLRSGRSPATTSPFVFAIEVGRFAHLFTEIGTLGDFGVRFTLQITGLNDLLNASGFRGDLGAAFIALTGNTFLNVQLGTQCQTGQGRGLAIGNVFGVAAPIQQSSFDSSSSSSSSGSCCRRDPAPADSEESKEDLTKSEDNDVIKLKPEQLLELEIDYAKKSLNTWLKDDPDLASMFQHAIQSHGVSIEKK